MWNYNRDLGAEPQRGPGAKPPEAESFEAFAHKKAPKFAVNMPKNRMNMALTVRTQTQPSPIDPHWQLITGVQGQSPCSGVGGEHPEAESFKVFAHLKKAQKAVQGGCSQFSSLPGQLPRRHCGIDGDPASP